MTDTDPIPAPSLKVHQHESSSQKEELLEIESGIPKREVICQMAIPFCLFVYASTLMISNEIFSSYPNLFEIRVHTFFGGG